MKKPNEHVPVDTRRSKFPEVRISVTDLGSNCKRYHRSAAIDGICWSKQYRQDLFRHSPLRIAKDSGRISTSFPITRHFFRSHPWRIGFFLKNCLSPNMENDTWEKECQTFLDKLVTEGRPFSFTDLPGGVRNTLSKLYLRTRIYWRRSWRLNSFAVLISILFPI